MKKFRLALPSLPLAVLLAALLIPLAGAAQAQENMVYDTTLYGALEYRMIGPFRAGRVTAVTGIAEKPYTYFMGGTGGGIDTVAFASIDPGTGALGSWSSTTVLPSGDWFNRAAVVDNTIIHATGNLNSGNDRHIHHATINVGGGLSAWSDDGVYDATSGNRWDFGMCHATASGEFAVIIGGNSGAHTFPYIENKNLNAVIEHEATASKVSDEQLFLCQQRGIDAEKAVSMIVNGFCKDVFRELPMEFAVEAGKLLEVSLEGAVG